MTPPAANRVWIDVSEIPCRMEQEPNETCPQAMELASDVAICGQFGSSLDEDWFRFAAVKDQWYAIDCKPLPRSSPALPVVAIVGDGGAVLARLARPSRPIAFAGSIGGRRPTGRTI